MFIKEKQIQYENYLKSLKKEDKIALMYHADADGIASAVIIAKTIEFLRKEPVDYPFSQGIEYNLSESTLNLLKSGNYNKFILVDLSVDSEYEKIREIETFADILIVDHHEFSKDLSSDKTIFINVFNTVENKKGAEYPASKLIYDLSLNLANIENLDWLVSAGIVGDIGFNSWKDFINSTLTKYNEHITEKGPQNIFGRITGLINSARIYNPSNMQECYEIVYNAKSYKDVLFNKKLIEYKLAVKEETNHLVEDFKKIKGENWLYIYTIHPRFNIGSTLSTILSIDYIPRDNTLIVIADNGEDIISISARRQDGKSRMNELLQLSIKDIPNSSAGGHIPAAGGSIPKEYITKFKNNLIKVYNEHNGII